MYIFLLNIAHKSGPLKTQLTDFFTFLYHVRSCSEIYEQICRHLERRISSYDIIIVVYLWNPQ